jgi:hypothetical protein
MGYSQGAAVGAAALRMAARYGLWKLGNSGLFEAPNCFNRTPLQLVRDFMATQHFSRTVRESAIPLLSEVQHTRGGLDALVQVIGAIELGVSTCGVENRVIRAALGKDQFIDDVEAAAGVIKDATVTVGAGLKSRIMPPAILDKLNECAQDLPQLRVLGIAGYGHEMADNIVAHTLLARAALAGGV